MPASAESVEALNEALGSGMRLHRDGELLRAEHIYRKILEVFPDLPEALCLLGLIAQQTGHHGEARKLALRALDARPTNVAYRELLAHALRGQKRFEEALEVYRRADAQSPDKPEVLIGMGLALKALERFPEAAAAFGKATMVAPASAEAWVNLGNMQRKTDDWIAAVASYERAIALNPSLPEAHNNLGAALIDLNQDDRARECFGRAREFNAAYAEPLYNLGRVALLNGDLTEAMQWLARAVETAPEYADAWVGKGIVHASEGEMERMLDCFRRAVEIRPDDAETFFSFGAVLLSHGHPDHAIRLLDYGLSLRPDTAVALTHLGTAQHQVGLTGDAMQTFRKLFALNTELPDAQVNYANLLVSVGRVAEAIVIHRAVRERDPGSPDANANLLLDHCYVVDDAAQLDKVHREWPSAAQLPPTPPARVASGPQRRLRIGLVSGDLRTHSVAYFIEPLFEHLDAEAFEIHAYSNSWLSDDVTARMHARAAGWRRIAGVPDGDVCKMIHEDGIDILIDLSGHTGSSRSWVFAARPAPVQVSYLGYPTITGVPSMDYRLTDWQVDPAGGVEQRSEMPVRLPHSYFCYRPSGLATAVGPLPAARNGWISFGSFNNLAKLSPATLALWREVLMANSGSRLLLKCKGLSDPETQTRLRAQLCDERVAEERLILRPWDKSGSDHLETYNEVDIALDTFPYNGATTTCEALWMGVPVVTLAGATHPARMGLSILSAAGLPELAAATPEQYVALASAMAADVAGLAELRAGMRAKVGVSPLLDAVGFARDFGAALRTMWTQACARATA